MEEQAEGLSELFNDGGETSVNATEKKSDSVKREHGLLQAFCHQV